MLLVLMRIGPFRAHVLSRLTTSPPSVDNTVYCILSPRSLFGLAVPDLGAWFEIPSPHMQTYTVTSNYHEYDEAAIKIHISLITSI